ncbi:MAG: CBS domain-containing protein [Candidatus Bathyarchaeota archaeon]|nr:CBS domain-containing protein [Candidatus Bathyarchaeota archaeon]MDW8040074.1 CBS domain-containing protein [Nitrososphaerota archaeon]
MRVGEITNQKHPSIYEDDLATKARALIRDFSLRILPVVNNEKRLVGVVSRGSAMTISSSVSPIKVKGIMAKPKYTATMEDDAYQTVREMIRLDEWCIPVVNTTTEKILKGVLGLENFIENIIKTSPEKLAKPVSDIMSTKVITCTPEDEVDNVWLLMQEKALGGLPVVANNKLVGIVTQKDLLESGALLPTFESPKGRHKASTKISAVMKTNVVAVQPSIKAIRVAKTMVSKDIGRVPVVDKDGKLIGIVDREDIARLIIKQ